MKQNDLYKKNRGIIHIQTDLLKSMEFNVLGLIFNKFIPVGIIHEFYGVSKYEGFSYEFDEIKEGEEVPVYDCLVTYENRLSDPVIEFKRQNYTDHLKHTSDLVATVSGKEIEFIIDRIKPNRS